MSAFSESVIEKTALAWLDAIGWHAAHVPDMALDVPASEWADYGDVAPASRLCDTRAGLDQEISADARDDFTGRPLVSFFREQGGEIDDPCYFAEDASKAARPQAFLRTAHQSLNRKTRARLFQARLGSSPALSRKPCTPSR